MWEVKVFAAADADADAAETDWKHKVTPERGDLMTDEIVWNYLSIESTDGYISREWMSGCLNQAQR